MSSVRRTWLAGLVTLIVGGACDVSVEDMRKWKDLKDGERRIAAFVSDSGRSMPQRVTAAMVLVEIDQSFILADALKQSEAKDRQQIVSGMLPKLLEMLKGKPKDQPRAKDALYLVGGYLDVEDRTKAARAVARPRHDRPCHGARRPPACIPRPV